MTNVFPLTPEYDFSRPETLKLDIENPRPKQVNALIEAFEAHMKTNPELGPLPVKEGWNDITPETAINLFLRNRPGANRKIDPGTVFYYGSQMARGEWQPTGQALLFGEREEMKDGQHRALAGIISGETFKTFVVTDVPAVTNLFAYIDNSRPRTAATALQTAGHNGVASLISKVVRLGEEVRHGVFSATGKDKLGRLSPADVLALIARYPNAKTAARSAASDWDHVVDYLDGGVRKEVVAYFGMRVIDLHGDGVVEEFFDELMDDREDRANDDPIKEFRKVMEKDRKADKPMKKQRVLANLIYTFNAWRSGKPLAKRFTVHGSDEFPQFNEPEEAEQAA